MFITDEEEEEEKEDDLMIDKCNSGVDDDTSPSITISSTTVDDGDTRFLFYLKLLSLE